VFKITLDTPSFIGSATSLSPSGRFPCNSPKVSIISEGASSSISNASISFHHSCDHKLYAPLFS
jgi:hypothetical protein